MATRKHLVFLSIIILFAFSYVANGQSLLNSLQQEKSSKVDTVQLIIESISLNNINNASTEAFVLFTRVNADKLAIKQKKRFENAVDTVIIQTSTFFSDTAGMEFESLNFRELEIMRNTLLLLQNDISDLQELINLLGNLVINQLNYLI